MFSLRTHKMWSVVVVNSFNPSTLEVKTSESLNSSQPGIYNKHQISQRCMVIPCLKSKKKKSMYI